MYVWLLFADYTDVSCGIDDFLKNKNFYVCISYSNIHILRIRIGSYEILKYIHTYDMCVE